MYRENYETKFDFLKVKIPEFLRIAAKNSSEEYFIFAFNAVHNMVIAGMYENTLGVKEVKELLDICMDVFEDQMRINFGKEATEDDIFD